MKTSRISLIVAMDEKQGIGKKNDLLFKIPEDFKRMKALTEGHPIIMGRKTFESIGRVLPKRTNIIVTRDQEFHFENVLVSNSLEDALRDARNSQGSEEIFIFGGGQIFKEALEKDLVDRLYLTIVKGSYDADTFFPEYKRFGFTSIKEEQGESDGYQYTFLDLER